MPSWNPLFAATPERLVNAKRFLSKLERIYKVSQPPDSCPLSCQFIWLLSKWLIDFAIAALMPLSAQKQFFGSSYKPWVNRSRIFYMSYSASSLSLIEVCRQADWSALLLMKLIAAVNVNTFKPLPSCPCHNGQSLQSLIGPLSCTTAENQREWFMSALVDYSRVRVLAHKRMTCFSHQSWALQHRKECWFLKLFQGAMTSDLTTRSWVFWSSFFQMPL